VFVTTIGDVLSVIASADRTMTGETFNVFLPEPIALAELMKRTRHAVGGRGLLVSVPARIAQTAAGDGGAAFTPRCAATGRTSPRLPPARRTPIRVRTRGWDCDRGRSMRCSPRRWRRNANAHRPSRFSYPFRPELTAARIAELYSVFRLGVLRPV
jgi:hypothetical protein